MRFFSSKARWNSSQVFISIVCATGTMLVLHPDCNFLPDMMPTFGDGATTALGFALFNSGAVLITNEKLYEENILLLTFFTLVSGMISTGFLLSTNTFPGIVEIETMCFKHPDKISMFLIVLAALLLLLMNILWNAGFCAAKTSAVANLIHLQVLFVNWIHVVFVDPRINFINIAGSAMILLGSILSVVAVADQSRKDHCIHDSKKVASHSATRQRFWRALPTE